MSEGCERITIIGASLAGTFLTILLSKKGFKVDIFERLDEKHFIDNHSKKSFNITFSAYAVNALKQAGLWKLVKKEALSLKGSINQIGESPKPIVSKFDADTPYYTISREKLLLILIKIIKKQKINLHFCSSLESIDKKTKTLTFASESTKKKFKIKSNVVIGADGVNSKVRSFLQRQKGSKHSQIYENWEYKEIKFNQEISRKISLKKDYSYSWTRKNSIITGCPAKDGSFTGMLVLPKTNGPGFENLRTPVKIKEFIIKNYPVFVPTIIKITKDISNNPKSNFVTVHTHPWYYKGFILIIGDAAHGFPPFLGQGLSTAFGDALDLVKLLESYNNNWGKVMPIFQELRKKHMDALGEFSRETFTLYRRYKYADYTAIYNNIEQTLYKLLPKFFLPSPSNLIAENPGKTAYIIAKHHEQRRFLKRLGIPKFVTLLTRIYELKESFQLNIFGKIKIIKRLLPSITKVI